MNCQDSKTILICWSCWSHTVSSAASKSVPSNQCHQGSETKLPTCTTWSSPPRPPEDQLLQGRQGQHPSPYPKAFSNLTALQKCSVTKVTNLRAQGSSQVAQFCEQPHKPPVRTTSEAWVKHIKHWGPSAVYLQLYTLQHSLYFIMCDYIYYITLVFLYGKLKCHQKCIFSCPSKAAAQADKLRKLILKPVAVLTCTILVCLHPSFLAARSSSISTRWQGLWAQLGPAKDRYLLQCTLLLALFVQSPPLMKRWYLELLQLFSSACCMVSLNTLPTTHPTNHHFNLCLSREFHTKSWTSCKVNLRKQEVRAALCWGLLFVCFFFF